MRSLQQASTLQLTHLQASWEVHAGFRHGWPGGFRREAETRRRDAGFETQREVVELRDDLVTQLGVKDLLGKSIKGTDQNGDTGRRKWLGIPVCITV